MRINKKAVRPLKEGERYELFWEYKGLKGTGYSFLCDSNGEVDVSKLTVQSKEIYHSLVAGKDPAPWTKPLKGPEIIILQS